MGVVISKMEDRSDLQSIIYFQLLGSTFRHQFSSEIEINAFLVSARLTMVFHSLSFLLLLIYFVSLQKRLSRFRKTQARSDRWRLSWARGLKFDFINLPLSILYHYFPFSFFNVFIWKLIFQFSISKFPTP